MTHNFSTDFNSYETQNFSAGLIPVGTLAKVIFHIKPGGFGPEGLFTQSAMTGTIYINGEFTIVEGPYAKRKIFQRIGMQGNKPDDVWSKHGRALLRSLVESAKNINPNDHSEAAQQGRSLSSFSELDGMICAVRIGIEQKNNDQFEARNKILAILTPDHKGYPQVMHPTPSVSNWAMR